MAASFVPAADSHGGTLITEAITAKAASSTPPTIRTRGVAASGDVLPTELADGRELLGSALACAFKKSGMMPPMGGLRHAVGVGLADRLRVRGVRTWADGDKERARRWYEEFESTGPEKSDCCFLLRDAHVAIRATNKSSDPPRAKTKL
jgi:hypothetical protein